MKKILLMAMSAMLACVACDKDNFNYSGLEEGYGRLSFADAEFIVSEETDTRAGETELHAAGDNTVIWVLSVGEDGSTTEVDLAANDPDITYVTYGAVKSTGITLPAGNYILRAQTAAEIAKAGTTPVYGIEKDFVITAGAETDLGELTLNLYKQVKVSVSYNDEFMKSLTTDGGTTTVTIDNDNVLTFWVKPDDFDSDSKYLFIELDENTIESGATMEILVTAEMNVKEDGETSIKTQKMTAAITGVKPQQHRKIKIEKTVINDGGANFTIKVNDLEVDTELSTDISAAEGSLGDDPNAPKGDGGINLINNAGLTGDVQNAWNAYVTQTEKTIAGPIVNGEITDKVINGVHKEAITVNGLTELTFSAEVPNGVYEFYVDITSTNPDFAEAVAGITVNSDGRIYLTKTEAEHSSVVTKLNGLGITFPKSEDVIDKKSVEFPLTSAIDPLKGFKGTHYFTMNVSDKQGYRNIIVLTLIVE